MEIPVQKMQSDAVQNMQHKTFSRQEISSAKYSVSTDMQHKTFSQ
jgi:hypothetical protein